MSSRAELPQLMARAARRAVDSPEWFCRAILRFNPLPWQIDALHAVFDVRRKAAGRPTRVNHEGRPRITIRSCHGTGKTQLLALLLHFWNFTTYGRVACTAPKQDQLLRRLLPRYRKILRGAAPEYASCIQVLGTEIICFGDRDWGAVMETASDPDNLAGYHETPQLFVIDEAGASRLDPMYPVIEGALTTPGSVVVEIGNPTRVEGGFYRHHYDAALAGLYYRIHVKYTDAPSLISLAWVEAMRRIYGENSPIYKIRVLGEAASFDSAVLIPFEFFERALDTQREADGSVPKLRVSADIADGGVDMTVFTVALHYETFVKVVRQVGRNWEPSKSPVEAYRMAVTLFEAFGGRKETDDFVIDAVGVGAGTAGLLIESGYNVIRHVGSEKGGRYRNRRTANYMSLYKAYVEDTIVIAPGASDNSEILRKHVMSIKRASSDRGDDIETKDKLKSDGNPSPDYSDSLSMQFIDKSAELYAENIDIHSSDMETADYDDSALVY